MKKILIIMNTLIYNEIISGADVLSVELAKRLKRKYDISVMTTNLGKKFWRGMDCEICFYIIPSFDVIVSKIFVPIILILRGLWASLIKPSIKCSPNLLYSCSDYFCDILPAIMMKKKLKNSFWIARIYHIIPHPNKRKGNYIINTLAYVSQKISFWLIKRYSNLILSLSGSYSKLIKIGFPRNKLAISNPGIDFQKINKIESPKNKKYDGVYFGRLHSTKGIYDAIEIWERVCQKKKYAKLIIMGGGEKSTIKKIKQIIENKKLQDNIKILGFVKDYSSVLRYLKSSKIYINPEMECGWGITTTEAMSCGIPAVTYKLHMFTDVFQKGIVSVNLHDIDEFSRNILSLLEDDKKRLLLSKDALEESKKYTWEEVIKKLIRYIENLQ